MGTRRNYTGIERAAGVAGERMQCFTSNAVRVVMEQVQQEIRITSGPKRGGVVILDDSADEGVGDKRRVWTPREGRLEPVEEWWDHHLSPVTLAVSFCLRLIGNGHNSLTSESPQEPESAT